MTPVRMGSEGVFRVGSQFHYVQITELSATKISHSHNFYELFMIVKGGIRHLVNGLVVDMNEGDLVLIRPDDCHCYERRIDASCRFVNLAFTPAVAYDAFRFLDHDFQQTILNQSEPPCVRAPEATIERALNTLRDASALPDGDGAVREALLKSLLFELLTGFVHYEAVSGDMPVWLERLLNGMRSAGNFTAGMPAMRALSGCTPEHLARSFRKYLGTTPTDYINQLRLNYIRNMLVDTDLGIAEIGEMGGFDSVSHMNHIFREAYGMTPSEYRHENIRKVIP